MTDAIRVAAYFCPLPDDPLYTAGISWLGHDPTTNALVRQPEIRDIAEITAEPRVYGFHATLKPPMRLAEGKTWSDLVALAYLLAGRTAPFDLPPLAVMDLRGFLALRETEPCKALQAFADASVELLDACRAEPSETELARRRKALLTPEQEAMLQRWGYPYVFGTWFFHMTLTRRLNESEKAVFLPAAKEHFAAALAVPRRVTDICLYTQRAPGERFVIAERLPLRG